MKIFIKFLLITFIALIALLSCQNARQQTDTKDVLTIDSASVVINNSLEDTASLDSTIIENITMPDSVKINMHFSTKPMREIIFFVNPNSQSYVDITYIFERLNVKEPLSKVSSNIILRIIGDIFIDHKTPVIISKKNYLI